MVADYRGRFLRRSTPAHCRTSPFLPSREVVRRRRSPAPSRRAASWSETSRFRRARARFVASTFRTRQATVMPQTSDGIFVFGGNNDSVNLGDVVLVSGSAGEFQDQTQISASSIVRCGTGTVAAGRRDAAAAVGGRVGTIRGHAGAPAANAVRHRTLPARTFRPGRRVLGRATDAAHAGLIRPVPTRTHCRPPTTSIASSSTTTQTGRIPIRSRSGAAASRCRHRTRCVAVTPRQASLAS